jgi:hypothetical protein
MHQLSIGFSHKTRSLYQWASVLALITIFYNIGEGLVSVFFGLEDESFALFGFGLDSFVEVSSGIGIWHMIRRIRRNEGETTDHFERTALKITGGGFYLLTVGLTITAVINLYQGHKPETTFWGIVISLISIATMWLLIHYKVKVGKALNSQAILSDAACTRACLHLPGSEGSTRSGRLSSLGCAFGKEKRPLRRQGRVASRAPAGAIAMPTRGRGDWGTRG